MRTNPGLGPCATIVLLALLLAFPAGAEQGRVSLSLGNGGWSVPRRWAPLWVGVEPAPARGRVEVRRLMRDGAPPLIESQPLGVDGRAECPVFMDHGMEAIEVSVFDGSVLIGKERLDPWAKSFPGHVIACHDIPAPAQKALASFLFPSEPVQVALISEGDFPAVALDYDGLGAVVLDGDSLSFNPAQRDSLAAFVSGGGVLVIMGARPERFNAPGLGLPMAAAESPGGPFRLASFGLGRIALFPESASACPEARTGEFWNAVLGMDEFESSPRAIASFMAEGWGSPAESSGAARESEEGPGKPGPGAALAFIFWGGAGFALLFGRKRPFAAILAFLALSVAGFTTAGALLDREWMRGASVQSRLLVLPGKAGVLGGIRVSRPLPKADASNPGPSMPRRTRLSFDDAERGIMDPLEPFAWRHDFRSPYLSAASADAESVTLTGFLPLAVMEGSSAFQALSEPYGRDSVLAAPAGAEGAEQLLLGADGSLLVRAGGEWVPAEDYPAWAAASRDWLGSAARSFPGQDLLLSLEETPGLAFAVQGRRRTGAAWIMPLGGE